MSLVTPEAIRAARGATDEVARRTPILASRTLSELLGGRIALKAESLQRTGAFKLRGALSAIAALAESGRGVVCGSAGNHAQGIAYAARERDVPCLVVMPADAPVQKVEQARSLGARVELVAGGVGECLDRARGIADAEGSTFVHPYDDPAVICGQGTIGLELLEDVPDLARVVVPVGGGGLAAGVAVAVRSARPEVEVIGVRAAGRGASTIADGIAVPEMGEVSGPIVAEWVASVVEVADDAIAAAMVHLLERSKLVVEGAGAVGVAALVAGEVAPATEGVTAVVLSGGNADAGLLAEVARHHETDAGRRLVILTRVPDRPGRLASLLGVIAAEGANLLDVDHVREGIGLRFRETAVQLTLETRGAEHAERVVKACEEAGYEVRRVGMR